MNSRFIVFSILLFFLAGGCLDREVKKYEFDEYLMHTDFKIILYSEISGQAARKLALQAFGICRDLENRYSTTITNSLIYRLNRKGYMRIDPETYSILKKALQLSAMSGGKFDITIYPLMKIWGFENADRRIPGRKEITEALKRIGYKNIILFPGSVRLLNGAEINLGGILKGYAVNKMIGFLKSGKIAGGIVDAGGNLGVFGRKPDGTEWNIGIRNPRGGGIFRSIHMDPDNSVATSGDYEQFLMTNNIRYSHIFDPATGYPARSSVASVSVIRPYPENSDGYSCSFFLMGPESGIAYADKHGIPVFYIMETNSVLYTAQSALWK